jgi:DNA primase
MGKLAQATSKYTVYAHFAASGTVEKPDIIGAVFGQTEGLLGKDMDLRELQKTGRVGRIDVDSKTIQGKTGGYIIIPSSLDASETALIAACVETIERVGPCTAKINIERIEDVRASKRQYVIERAKELLAAMYDQGSLELEEITEQIKESVRKAEVVQYKGLAAGPGVTNSDEIIIVEGRADVVNLLRCGIKNSIAMGGTSVPPVISEISKQKEITAFLDGDRGGDLNYKELMSVCDLDFVARAPDGKEVEELTKKELYKALREKIPASSSELFSENKNNKPSRGPPRNTKPPQRRETRTTNTRTPTTNTRPTTTNRPPRPSRESTKKSNIDPRRLEIYKEMLESLTGTRAALFLDELGGVIGKVPVPEMFNALKQIDADSLIIDGEIDQKLANFCAQRGVKYLIGAKLAGRIRFPESTTVLTQENL